MENEEEIMRNFEELFPDEFEEVVEAFKASGFITLSEYLMHAIQEFMMFKQLSEDIEEETIKEIENLTKKIILEEIY